MTGLGVTDVYRAIWRAVINFWNRGFLVGVSYRGNRGFPRLWIVVLGWEPGVPGQQGSGGSAGGKESLVGWGLQLGLATVVGISISPEKS